MMMKLPFTQKMLVDWAGPTVFKEAEALYERGAVLSSSFEDGMITGTLMFGSRELSSRGRVLKDHTLENLCPCRDNKERGIVCVHVTAVSYALVRRSQDPQRDRKLVEERRKAVRMSRIDPAHYLKRSTGKVAGALPAKVMISLHHPWRGVSMATSVKARVYLDVQGAKIAIDQAIRGGKTYQLSEADEALIFVLEDIAEGIIPGEVVWAADDMINVLQLLRGRRIEIVDSPDMWVVNAAVMGTRITVDLDRENGELLLIAHTELPHMKPGKFPAYLIGSTSGWVWGAGHLWPLEKILPGPLQSLYREPIAVPRASVPRFLDTELPMLENVLPVDAEVTPDLFTIEPGQPTFHLGVRGSPASLAATLTADYAGVRVIAGKPDPSGYFAHPDPEDLLRYTVRNPEAEKAGLSRLADHGLKGEVGDGLTPVVGCREVLNFLGSNVPALRRLGWRVDVEGPAGAMLEEARFITPVVSVQDDREGAGWFDVSFDYDDGEGNGLSAAEVQRALRKGDAFLERGGKTYFLDSDAIESMNGIFSDCQAVEGAGAGRFRLPALHASYVKSSLDALDGVDVEATPGWLDAARRMNRDLTLEPIEPIPGLRGVLRPYQQDGLNWLVFTERAGFGGILADEMGLGKTLQTLAWLAHERHNPEVRRSPALIVCPTSLVENWAEEAQKFVPDLQVVILSGADRHDRWEQVDDADLVITSYALLRRDIEKYQEQPFAVAVLDEAQHIKNRNTQNAQATRRILAHHRLVLTGTPIENSVSDLWSIMDFLMPGYLGKHDDFRQKYELPISRGEQEGDQAQARLRRKLHPFLLRRLKKDVAKDLPPKIERVAFCRLTPDQQTVYKELLEASRRRISDLVSAQGFDRSRMEILKTLLRLRQVSCHLDLLKMPGLESKAPSAKLDLFLELLDEAVDGGHRVLVFSQFVSMLTLLRTALEERNLTYCYLDGSTKERMKEVHRFNSDRSVPVFLISLKAGGTGLNLTGADMVIHFDPWWNPAVENQATDRAYRIGQKRTVYSVKLIAKDTVEEKVLAMQKRKKAVIDATLESDEQVIQKMNWDDVKALLEG